MKLLIQLNLVFALIAPTMVKAQDNFGQFVQRAAHDDEFRRSLPDQGFRNFGAWVSSHRRERQGGDDAVRGRSEGHRRDGRGSDGGGDAGGDSGGDALGGVSDDGGGDTLGSTSRGKGRGHSRK